MKDLFVPYKLAFKLKDKGFDEPCICLYRLYKPNSIRWFAIDQNWGCILHGMCIKHGYTINDDECLAPLYQQVIEWLETKRIFIDLFEEHGKWILSIHHYVNLENVGDNLKHEIWEHKGPWDNKIDPLNKGIELAIELIK